MSQYDGRGHSPAPIHGLAPTTTRSGRASRPPVAPPPSLAVLHSVLPDARTNRRSTRPADPQERLDRQRERNRESAMRARQRKKEKDSTVQEQLQVKTAECEALANRCRLLEEELGVLKEYLYTKHGMSAQAVQMLLPKMAPMPQTALPIPAPSGSPSDHHGRWWNTKVPSPATPTSYLRAAPSPLSTTLTPTDTTLAVNPHGAYMDIPAVTQGTARDTLNAIPDLGTEFAGGDGYELLSFSALFGFDVDGDDADANDTDFVPPTSPKGGESSDGGEDEDEDDGEDEDEDDDEEEEDEEDADGEDHHRVQKRRRTAPSPFLPEDIASDEEEDLFLPITDVPVPVEQLYRDAMEALGVSTEAELTAVVSRIADASARGEVTAEQVEGIRRLMRLAEAQGIYHE